MCAIDILVFAREDLRSLDRKANSGKPLSASYQDVLCAEKDIG